MGRINQKPKISKHIPAPFNLISMKKGKKNFLAFKDQHERVKKQDNFILEKLDDAVNAEEYKHTLARLQPITLDRAHTKIDSYQSGMPNASVRNKKGGG